MTMEQASSVAEMGLELVEPLNDAEGWRRVIGSIPGPRPMDPAAYYGMVGAYSIALQPICAYDVVAVHAQNMAFLGNIIGRVGLGNGAATIFPNVMSIVCTGTAMGKGSSLAHSMLFASKIDEHHDRRILTSVGSPEGLIRVAATEITTTDPKTRETRTEFTGVTEERVMVVHEEWSEELKRCLQQPTFGSFYCQAADGVTLMSVVKAETLRGTPHVSKIGHCTPDQMQTLALTSENITGGYLNRHDIFLVKPVSLEQPMDSPDSIPGLFDLAEGVKGGLERFKDLGESRFFLSDEAEIIRSDTQRFIRETYTFGALQHLSVRFVSKMLKASMVFAASDGTNRISEHHLLAARAYQAYAFRSVSAFLTSGSVFFDSRDTLLSKWAEQDWVDLSLSDVGDLFNRNQSAYLRDSAINALERDGLLTKTKHKTGGRPTTMLSINRDLLHGAQMEW